MILTFEQHAPRVHDDAWVAPGATVIGDVELGAGSSVWFGAVIRGDTEVIRIGHRSNVQDGSVLHEGVTIGKRCVLGHQVLVHETTLGDGVLIGNGAKVTALGAGSGASALTGLDSGTGFNTGTATGVLVQATSSEEIMGVVVAGGAGLYAGVGGAVSVGLFNSATRAYIGTGAEENRLPGTASAPVPM